MAATQPPPQASFSLFEENFLAVVVGMSRLQRLSTSGANLEVVSVNLLSFHGTLEHPVSVAINTASALTREMPACLGPSLLLQV